MHKFRYLIYSFVMFGFIKAYFAYSRQISMVDMGLQTDVNFAAVLNDCIVAFVLAVILTIFYFIISFLRKIRTKGKTLEGTASENDSQPLSEGRNVIGWYLFSALVLGAVVGGGGGYFFSIYTFNLDPQTSEIVGWVLGIALGVVSFKRKWELF